MACPTIGGTTIACFFIIFFHRAAFLDSPGPKCQNSLADKTWHRTMRSADAPLGGRTRLVNCSSPNQTGAGNLVAKHSFGLQVHQGSPCISKSIFTGNSKPGCSFILHRSANKRQQLGQLPSCPRQGRLLIHSCHTSHMTPTGNPLNAQLLADADLV